MLTTAGNHRTTAAKAVVHRLVDEVLNGGDMAVIDELYTRGMARVARRWIEPFRRAFPDLHMEVVQLVAEDDIVVGRFRCSGSHLGLWRDHAPTGRRFERIDEVYFFTFEGDRIAGAWGIEDTLERFRQLGLDR